MLPDPSPLPIARPDAELEWLLCLAAALQSRQNQPVILAAEKKSPEPTIRRRLQALLRRGTQRIPAA
jgi:hypothetical protein